MSGRDELYSVVLTGQRGQVEEVVQKALDEGFLPLEIIEKTLRPAMAEVGERFASAEFFLPDLILAANATKMATEYLRPLLADQSDLTVNETVVIGTVAGDLHDIGKNLVVATLEGAGYRVIDLGVDVKPENFVEAVREHDPAVVGFGALLSTTMVNVPKTISALAEAGLREGRLMAVGGAPVTQRNADEWGADIYAADAGAAVRIVNEALANRGGTGHY